MANTLLQRYINSKLFKKYVSFEVLIFSSEYITIEKEASYKGFVLLRYDRESI